MVGVHHAVPMRARRGYVPGMGDTTLMTADELLRLNLPDKRTELIRGRLVVRDPGGARHGAVAMIRYPIRMATAPCRAPPGSGTESWRTWTRTTSGGYTPRRRAS